MLQLLITIGQTIYDYTSAIDSSSISISERVNVPSQMTFTFTQTGGNLDVPPMNSYVQLVSVTLNNNGLLDQSVFSGYISAPPQYNFLGLSPYATPFTRAQMMSYQLVCTSDEYLINMKSVPFIPAFINRTQGQILSDLANLLCPGIFDTTLVQDGDIVPYYEYKPTQNWSQIAKTFGDSVRFRYKARDHKIFYVPYDDWPLGIQYDESFGQQTFKAQQLQTTPLAVPVVNDVTIVGQAEAGTMWHSYFIGDGFTGNFPLRHKVFKGASSVLLQDPWTETSLNEQQWFLLDPNGSATLDVGALNLVTPASGAVSAYGQSYLSMNNGVELAGGIVLQHGEFIFNDYCQGIVGGLYSDDTFALSGFLAGFLVATPGTISPGPSGTAGILIQPQIQGGNVGSPVITKANHTYVLETVVTAPASSRYKTIYRTWDSKIYGGVKDTLLGRITFNVFDYDIGSASGFFYTPNVTTFSAENITLPSFATYSLFNNIRLNVSISNTTLGITPAGVLQAYTGPGVLGLPGLFSPTGLVLPALDPVNDAEYRGVVVPWGGPGSNAIYPAPQVLQTTPTQLVLGNGFQLQAAQIASSSETDTLSFYAQTLPSAGTRIRLTSWESQAAVARVRDYTSIQEQSFISGDDGVRAAIVTDLNPPPRTSEDCDNAAQAYLYDRNRVYYNGTYTVESIFFYGATRDYQYWPCVGRYLFVNSPQRQIITQRYLVSALTITVLSLWEEILQFQIQFGADLFLDKVLRNFVDIHPANILTASDTANPPNPRYTLAAENASVPNVSNTFLPDITDLYADDLRIASDTVTVVFGNKPYSRVIEVRINDTNWGRGASWDLVGWFTGPTFTLTRTAYEQTWYMRQVDAAGVSLRSSRRSLAIHVAYPQQPSRPVLVSADSNFVQLDFAGDRRNVTLLEVRDQAGNPLLQRPVSSYVDLLVDLTQTRNTAPYQIYRIFYCQFINNLWDYGPTALYNNSLVAGAPECVYIPPLSPTSLSIGFRFGQMLNVIATDALSDTRSDVVSETWRVARDAAMTQVVATVINHTRTNVLNVTVPANSDLYVTCTRTDYLGPGTTSAPLHVPQGNLLASDYHLAQGSIPPFVTDNPGAIITYSSTTNSIDISMIGFNLIMPNGTVTAVAPRGPFHYTVEKNPGNAALGPGTGYYFYISMDSPAVGTNLYIDGPWFGAFTFRTQALAAQFADGRVPLANGPLVFSTAAVGTGGGSGGGSLGGGSCGVLDAEVRLLNGDDVKLRDVRIGMKVLSPENTEETIERIQIQTLPVWEIRCVGERSTTVAAMHTFYVDTSRGSLRSTVVDLLDVDTSTFLVRMSDGTSAPIRSIALRGVREICHITLSGPTHVYSLDGFWTHNVIYKG